MNGARKAENENIQIKESADFEGFFGMVNEVLNSKYEVNAVHTFKELEMLKNRFPKNIRFFAAFKENEMLGGAIIYETDTVAHSQYLASNDLGKSLRLMDLLIFSLLENYKQNKIWFDFGISTEQNGSYLNENLIKQKEEFGASCITYDTYKIKLNGNG